MTQANQNLAAASYRGKHFTMPELNSQGAVYLRPKLKGPGTGPKSIIVPEQHPIITSLNKPFDVREFLTPRTPISLGFLNGRERMAFHPGLPRTLDLPVQFPGSELRLPGNLARLAPLLQRILNYEARINPNCREEYYIYLTVDQGWVKPGKLQREAPCHVDGFQGGRWNPKVRANHTYTVCDILPTVYYPQPFDLLALDENKHNFFWEMNRQVWETNSEFAWRAQPGELTLMDCYCVHRGDEADVEVFRTFIRVSFEVRIFDRKGNAHNPLFAYDWPMVPRDIEGLNLVPFNASGDPSLFVFPWQQVDGTAHDDPKARTKPVLKRS